MTADSINDILPQNFAYVIFTFVYSYVLLMYLGINVGKARKKFGVKVIIRNFLLVIQIVHV